MKRLGILISGRGSNFESIARALSDGEIPAQIALVISNRPAAPGLDLARRMGFNTRCIASKGRSRDEFETEILTALDEAGVDHLCLAGFMRVLSGHFVRAFPGRILNIHPSLLPAFPGLDAQKQALEYGVRFTGCTVHLIDENVDAGPVILQAVVPVADDDTVETLSARILAQEHQIYPEAIRLVVENRIDVQGRRVAIRNSKAQDR